MRAQAAESLGMIGTKKVLGPLIESRADESPEVRFWCVFGLGNAGAVGTSAGWPSFAPWKRASAITATTATTGQVGIEALAMLHSDLRHARAFRETILRADIRELFDAAIQSITEAGFEPVTFGRRTPPS